MKKYIQHISILLFFLLANRVGFAQFGENIRYVRCESTHALSVPPNDDYSFRWSMTWGATSTPININDTTHVTQNITFSRCQTFYDVTVYPVLFSAGCYGEPIYMRIYTVEQLSLHAMNDVFYTDVNVPVVCDVSLNDFDELGYTLIYTAEPVSAPRHGTLTMLSSGQYTYTPDPDFVGIDSFYYEVRNDPPSGGVMYDNALATIVVRDIDRVSNLYVEKTGPVKALIGGTITYSIAVVNNGSDVAHNVVLQDTIPFGLFNPVYLYNNQPERPWVNSIELGTMNPGDTALVSIVADISPTTTRGTFIYNQALTYSDSYDPDVSDNDSIWATEIVPLYVDLPDQLLMPGCRPVELPALSAGNSSIVSYRWRPSTGLSDSTIANPIFTPDENTVGGIYPYVLVVTDSLGNVASDTINLVISDIPVAAIEGGDTLFRDINERLLIDGSLSTGDGLRYSWWTSLDGNIVSSPTDTTVMVDTLGIYHLKVTDRQRCESVDSVWVLLRSHPPVATNDNVYLVAGTKTVLPNNGADYLNLANYPDSQLEYLLSIDDTTFNVLDNDYDINNFNLHVSQIDTFPQHCDVFVWDSTGVVVLQPRTDFWGIDSLKYRVCNDGIPEKCSTAWLYIHSLRPPLNADLEVSKSAEPIIFWGDSVYYNILIFNNGPDTARFVSLYDQIDTRYLITPSYRISMNNGQDWNAWSPWRNLLSVTDQIVPITTPGGGNSCRVQIRAYIDPRAQSRGVTISNKAFITTDIIENDLVNDTSVVVSKVKEKVIARAGNDRFIGVCQDTIRLNGLTSGGENLTFHWSPESYFVNPNLSNPVFRPRVTASVRVTERVPVVLTVTDDDNISATDTMYVDVLPPPIANAGPDRYLRTGQSTFLDSRSSSGTGLLYWWSAIDGFLDPGVRSAQRPTVDTLGTYVLRVTDVAGCVSYDTVQVKRYYYPPVAIPDYYSTTPGTAVVSDGVVYKNLLYNDFDPNGLFDEQLTITPAVNRATRYDGRVTIGSDGSFTYTPKFGFTGDVDYFTYEVCNGQDDGCTRGYVKITVNNQAEKVNLSVDKTSTYESVLAGGDIEYVIRITNNSGEDQDNIYITDTLSSFILNPRYSFDGVNFPSTNRWNGQSPALPLPPGASRNLYIRGTISTAAHGRIYNAAMVSSGTFDEMFDWDDVTNRNVDTVSVDVESSLIARAELVERLDNNRNDAVVGVCDRISYLSAANSSAVSGIDGYSWQPSEFLTEGTDTMAMATFNGTAMDTTITFTLLVYSGDNAKRATVTVNFSPEVIADAGPDRKMNEGVPLTVDASGSQGAGAIYSWYKGSVQHAVFENGNPLKPIISSPGMYTLYAVDRHGCDDLDTVIIRENQLFALNDILVTIAGLEQTGNVATNDYDPNGDSIYYPGNVVRGPFHGTLLDNNGVKISGDGSYTYQPAPGYVGDDYFIYQVCDNNNPDLCVYPKVFIRVVDVDETNSQPVANPDVFFVNMNDTLTSNLLSNDYDFDGGTIGIDTNPTRLPRKGSVSINGDGTFTYIPTFMAEGADSFYYRIFDNGRPVKYDSAMVYVYIHKISGENHRPVAVDDAYFIVEKTIRGNLLLNDYDPDENDVFVMDLAAYRVQTAHGTVDFLDQYGSFIYTPDSTFEGTDQLIYQIMETNTVERYSTFATVYFTCFSEDRYETDVSITKTGPAEMLSGGIIQYALTAKVIGPTLANDIVISDTLSVEHIAASVQYSRNGGIDWFPWRDTLKIERLMLYEEYQFLIRAVLTDTLSGSLSNIGWVGHDMVEKEPESNQSEWNTSIYQKVIANAGLDTLIGACVTEYQLDGSQSIGMSTLQYRWSPSRDLDNATLSQPVFTTTPGETQLFTLVVSCTYRGFTSIDTAAVRISVANSPVANAGDEFWDVVDPVTLDGRESYAQGSIRYLWWQLKQNGDTLVIDSTATVTVNRSGKYFLTVTDTFGCTSTDFTYVGYQIEPVVAIDDYVETPQDESIDIYALRNDIVDIDDEINLSAVIVSNDPSHGTVTWNPSDSTFTYTPELYYVGLDTFTYIVSTVYSSSDEAIVVINVLDRPALVPQGFSPNGDGINDVLIIENIEKYPNNSLVVFNRWGNVVYKKTKYSNSEPWDGVANKGVRIGSGAVPAGVYLYILDLGNKDIQKPIVKGNIYVATDN